MAEPLNAAELSDLRRRSEERMAGPSFTEADVDRARLLATLDAQKTATFDVLYDMRKRGVLVLDREKWRRYVPDDERWLMIAYTAFAILLPDEVEEHYREHPELLERDQATARRLYAERFPEGSRIRELAEQGAVTPGYEAAKRAWLALPREERLLATFPPVLDEETP